MPSPSKAFQSSQYPNIIPFDDQGRIGLGSSIRTDSKLNTVFTGTNDTPYLFTGLAVDRSSNLRLGRFGGTEEVPAATPAAVVFSVAGATTHNGTDFIDSVLIEAGAEVIPTGSSHPTFLRFSTTRASETAPMERMRIDSSGNVRIGSSTLTMSSKLNVEMDVAVIGNTRAVLTNTVSSGRQRIELRVGENGTSAGADGAALVLFGDQDSQYGIPYSANLVGAPAVLYAGGLATLTVGANGAIGVGDGTLARYRDDEFTGTLNVFSPDGIPGIFFHNSNAPDVVIPVGHNFRISRLETNETLTTLFTIQNSSNNLVTSYTIRGNTLDAVDQETTRANLQLSYATNQEVQDEAATLRVLSPENLPQSRRVAKRGVRFKGTGTIGACDIRERIGSPNIRAERLNEFGTYRVLWSNNLGNYDMSQNNYITVVTAQYTVTAGSNTSVGNWGQQIGSGAGQLNINTTPVFGSVISQNAQGIIVRFSLHTGAGVDPDEINILVFNGETAV